MKLTVLIPAYNEEQSLSAVLDQIPTELPGIDEIETIVVDDGSSDATGNIALAHGAHLVRHSTNQGLGKAFTTGIDAALRQGADIIVNLDADGQHPPQTIAKVIAPVLEGRADFVTATRFADPALIPDMPALKRFGNSLMARLTNWACGRSFTDAACGFRAYSRATALQLNVFGGHTYTQESLVDLARKGMVMVEVPIAIRGVREHGDSRVAHSVLRYGLRTSAILVRAVRDRLPLIFFGIIGLALSLFGAAAELTVLGNWLLTGRTSPYQSLVIVGGIFLILGAFSFLTALLADMLARIRETQETLLFYEKQRNYERFRTKPSSTSAGGLEEDERTFASTSSREG